jgi:hypothetical protein
MSKEAINSRRLHEKNIIIFGPISKKTALDKK